MSNFNPKRIDIPNNLLKEGKTVRIVGDHIWSGCSGRIIGEMRTLVGHRWKVKLNNGRSVGAKSFNLKVHNQ